MGACCWSEENLAGALLRNRFGRMSWERTAGRMERVRIRAGIVLGEDLMVL